MKKALVTTTINVPMLLEDYCKDFLEHGHVNDIEIIVVGDMKTPKEAKVFCEGLQDKYRIKITYMDMAEQTMFLPIEYFKFLPWNCIQRRNVGMLYAYHHGAEIIYTIDDDNFLHTKDYIGNHKIGQQGNLAIAHTNNGWYNVCNLLTEQDNKIFYHRGHSFKNRAEKKEWATYTRKSGKVVVNAGLWIGDPDVDAVTRMALSPTVINNVQNNNVALGIGTKSPFNSQNTALHRDVIPAYCLAAGLGRYDDIVASYFVKRIADHLGDYISFGLPLVNQVRNEHDLFKDYEAEKVGMQLVDRIVEWLYAIELKGKNYSECVTEILNSDIKISEEKLTNEQKTFILNMHKNYSMWQQVLHDLNKRQH